MRTSSLTLIDESVHSDANYSCELISPPVPEYIWCEVERLYSSIFSSKIMLAPDQHSIETLYAWIERSSQKITDIFLFRKKSYVIKVANEVIQLSPEVIQRFSKNIFETFSDVHFIQFHAVILRKPLHSGLAQSSVFSEDYILQLSSSKEQWFSTLSARTREKLRSYLRRALQKKNNIEFSVSRESNIDEKDVRAVLLLNQLRMQKKGKNYGMTSLEESQLCNQLQKTGCICILKKDGRICAGLLCTVTGTDVFMHVLAHDPSFDKLRLGLVCCCLTIEYVIEQQFKCLHFLWGHYDYKRQLGAQPIKLSRVLVARNLSVGLLHPLFFSRYFFDRVRDLLRAFRHRRKVRINHWLRRSPC